MLKVEVGDCGLEKIEVQGEISLVCADTLIVISEIYRVISSKNESAGELYKNCVKDALNDDLPFKSNAELFKGLMDEVRKDLREADN